MSSPSSPPSVVINENCSDQVMQGQLALANEIHGTTGQVLQSLGSDARSLAADIGDVKYNAVKSVSDSERGVLKSIYDATNNVNTFIDRGVTAVKQDISASIASTERNGGDTRVAVERNGAANLTAINATASDVRAGNAAQYAALALDNKDIQLAICESKGYLDRENLKEFCSVKSRIDVVDRDLSRQASDNFATLRLQASENNAKILIDAQKTQYELSKRMDDCCCELKERITLRGDKTDALINNLEVQRLRDQVAEARNSSLANLILAKLGAPVDITAAR
jgi:hypothetical protein